MVRHQEPPTNEEIQFVDLSSIALPRDKINECKFFLELAAREPDRSRFRWFVSAFLNAVYSYFEIRALSAYEAYSNPETGEYIEDANALEVLRRYVLIHQDKKNPAYVKTSGCIEVLESLYDLRKHNTHHYPLAIMESDIPPPEGFQFGCLPGKGTPALAFCRNIMCLIEDIEAKLRKI